MNKKQLQVRHFVIGCLGLCVGAMFAPYAWAQAARTPTQRLDTSDSRADRLTPYQPRFGRKRPVIAVVAENYYTELSDYVVPYGILSAASVADVYALATQPGPIRIFPAPMNIQPQATIAAFDRQYPQGADYIVVPAVHRDDDPTLLAWVREQSAKGSVIVGVCDGVRVLAQAGLLDGHKATTHWYSIDELGKRYPATTWQRDRRYIEDGKIITTTGVTANIPVSLAIIEAIAGTQQATSVAHRLGGPERGWSARHPTDRFHLTWRDKFTIAGNFASFWAHEEVGIKLEPGFDEISLALKAEVYSATYRSKALTVADSAAPVKSKRGLYFVPATTVDKAPRRMLSPPDGKVPLLALDQALKGLAADYGQDTASWVALQMEYPGY
ncbi:DJ-1/PfpI family protein [Variovorax sp. J22R133]|uniref:DJ-1/PfpI family protein n=1 Tax=Variovorax brevis TaxID=3053503 RepID=UPI002574CFF9|nr:DJ-1/PfpI family protein [Variovorax sp. J22R133]MDM0116503.1 DJ-1/PfpI family protein [Variovorax sp. J22R133]